MNEGKKYTRYIKYYIYIYTHTFAMYLFILLNNLSKILVSYFYLNHTKNC